MKNTIRGLLAGLLACAVLVPGHALAQSEDIQSIFVKMDKTVNGLDDQFMDSTMTIIGTDGSSKSYDFTTLQKGDKRLIRFTSGEMKGLATLILGPGNIYTYIPSQRKIRRVAAHNMKSSFAGSDFSNDDMSFASWPDNYKPTFEKEDATHWYLMCEEIPGKAAPYPKARVKIQKGNYQLDGWEYFNEKGEKIKSFENSKLKDFGGFLRNTHIMVTDARTGHKTRLDVHDFKANQGVPDSKFTQRELEWGR